MSVHRSDYGGLGFVFSQIEALTLHTEQRWRFVFFIDLLLRGRELRLVVGGQWSAFCPFYNVAAGRWCSHGHLL
jgi:hypothetical protein